jgi:hypothetical protein
MTARLLRALLWVAIALVAGGSLLGLASIVQSASAGGAAQTTLPLRIEPAHASEVISRSSASPVGQLVLDRATLQVRAGGVGYAALQAVDILLTGGLWLLILFSARRLVRQMTEKNPFSGSAVARLRTIGVSMILLNCWMWVRMIALPPVLLAAVNPVSGEYRILPTIAAGADGMRNARVDTSFGIGLLAAGLIILLLSEAFRIGAALREDSESIV